MFTNDNKAHSCISCISSKGTSGLVHSKFHTMVPNVFSLIAAKQMEGCAEIAYSDGKQMLRGSPDDSENDSPLPFPAARVGFESVKASHPDCQKSSYSISG
ncbi:hypothetical protein Peur_055721 [Populus x canadensis]